MKLFIIDSLSPFFSTLPKDIEYNWSKVNFSKIENENGIDPLSEKIILDNFKTYLLKVKSLGYNSISIDELCRMVIFHFYNDNLKNKIKGYQIFYQKLFRLIKSFEIKIFITTDIMFFNNDIENYIKKKNRFASSLTLLKISIENLYENFSQIDGIIFRLGESDGLDVKGDFNSKLLVKTPNQCKRIIQELLPIFENQNKLLILRTWTLGAFPIGDLMWNQKTFNSVFNNINSKSLIVSHKFGEGDFMKYLTLNPLFYNNKIQKILEVQSRREYEGFGEFPNFIGDDYESINRYICKIENMVGIINWCQTGGWSHFTKLTFLRDSSLWNEINTKLVINIFKYNLTAKEAIYKIRQSHGDGDKFYKFLKLTDSIYKNVWYLPEFSSKRLYFRRSRVPTLLWVVWDNIIINNTLRTVLRSFVLNKQESIIDSYLYLNKIEELKELSENLDINDYEKNNLQFMYDTFNLIAHAREYYLGKWDMSLQSKITNLVKNYENIYPNGFHVNLSFSIVKPKKIVIKHIFKMAIRNNPQYTIFDKLILIKFSSLIYFVYKFANKKGMGFLDDQAMGVQTLLK